MHAFSKLAVLRTCLFCAQFSLALLLSVGELAWLDWAAAPSQHQGVGNQPCSSRVKSWVLGATEGLVCGSAAILSDRGKKTPKKQQQLGHISPEGFFF